MQQWICHIKGLQSIFGAIEVEKIGRQINGVNDLVVDFAGETLILSADSRDVFKKLEKRLDGLGYKLLDKGYMLTSSVYVESLADKDIQQHISKNIGSHSFVKKLDIKPISQYVVITHSADFSISEFVCDLNNQGVKAALHSQSLDQGVWAKLTTVLLISVVLLFLSGFLMQFLKLPYADWLFLTTGCLSIPILTIKAARQFILIKQLSYEMLLLIVVGIAIYASLWFEAAFICVCFLFLSQWEVNLGKLLREKWIKLKSRDQGFAFIQEDDGVRAVSLENLNEGDVVVVRAGSVIPIDGTVKSGQVTIDNRLLSVSEMVSEITVGDNVIAGMYVLSGEIEIIVTSNNNRGVMFDLHRHLESMQTQKSAVQNQYSRYSNYLFYGLSVITICSIAAIYIFSSSPSLIWVEKMLSIMVISGSVFVLLSMQFSYLFSFLIAAEEGIYFFNIDYWQKLSNITSIVLDKVGVVTKDRPEVHEVLALAEYSIKDVLEISANLAAVSQQKDFKALVTHASESGVQIQTADTILRNSEHTITVAINNQTFHLGSQSFMQALGLLTADVSNTLKRWQDEGGNIILLADEKEIIGLITIFDPVRNDVSDFIDQSHAEKLTLTLLSGDSSGASHVFSNRYGFDKDIAELTEEHKKQVAEKMLQNKQALLVSCKENLSIVSELGLSFVSNAIQSKMFDPINRIISLDSNLMPLLNVIKISKQLNARIQKLFYVVSIVKILLLAGILLNVLSLPMVIGLEFLLGFWVLFSTYRPVRIERIVQQY